MKTVQLTLTEAEGRRLFASLGIEVTTIKQNQYSTGYHNRQEVTEADVLVVKCPVRGCWVEFYEAYHALFMQRLSALILDVPRLDAYLIIGRLPADPILNNFKPKK